MCCCSKPTVNGQLGYRWNNPDGPHSVHPVNPPDLVEGDVMTEDSDPDKCTEGQTVMGTMKNGTNAPTYKQACTAGRDLARCSDNKECDTQTCKDGLKDKSSCDDLNGYIACLTGGGVCKSNPDGKCGSFPFFGNPPIRGSDDYKRDFPGDGGAPKLHCPSCGAPIWLDVPGFNRKQVDVKEDYKVDADFFAFVRGADGRCSCHFTLAIDWDGTNQKYRGIGLGLQQDGETVKCKIE